MSDLKRFIIGDETLLESPQDTAVSAGAAMGPYERIFLIGRYLGVGVLGCVQGTSPVPSIVKNNVTTVIALRCSNPREAREAAAMLGLTEERAQELLHLRLGEGFIRSVGFSGPVKVALPDFPLGAYLGNAEVEQRLSAERQWLAEHTIYSPSDSGTTVPLNVAEILGEQVAPGPADPVVVDDATRAQFLDEHRLLLEEIKRHPDASVTRHYDNLSWSAGRGNRVKIMLLEMDLVRVERRRSTNGRPCEILQLTEKGRRLLDELIAP